MSYTPPPGSVVTLNFAGLYSSPPGGSVTLEFTPPAGITVFAPSIPSALLFGEPSFSGQQFIAAAGGIQPGNVGAHEIDYPRIKPIGIDARITVGTPSLRWTQFVSAQGVGSTFQVGTPKTFNASGIYYAPYGGGVVLQFKRPTGEGGLGGSLVVEFLYPPAVRARGFSSARFGFASIVGPRQIRPQSILSNVFGEDVTVRIPGAGQQINAAGKINQLVFGSHEIAYLDRTVRPVGLVASLFGVADIAGGIRWVGVPSIVGTSFGAAFAAYKERFVLPTWTVATAFGNATIGFRRTLNATGFDASAFGLPSVFDNRTYVLGAGFDSSIIGDTFIAPRVRRVLPVSFWSQVPGQLPEQRWGRPEAYNSRQYVYQLFETTTDDGGVFGNFNDVANRDRIVGAIGWPSQRIPITTTIALTGRALETSSGNDHSSFGSHLIAYRIRTVRTQGDDLSVFTRWASLRNGARVVSAIGSDHSAVARPSVQNTRRFYDRITLGDQSLFGVAFAAYRIRTITQYFSHDSFPVPEPQIELAQRFVAPIGIPNKEVGAATIEEKFTIIAPRWIYVDRFGEARARNVTPEVGALGYEQIIWGATRIFPRWNY
ncbi:MAG: hypothetical protein ACRCWJ_21160, partial [Casimicrobium sp.]